MIIIVPHRWWDDMTYQYSNAALIEEILDQKRAREKDTIIRLEAVQLATNTITIEEG